MTVKGLSTTLAALHMSDFLALLSEGITVENTTATLAGFANVGNAEVEGGPSLL